MVDVPKNRRSMCPQGRQAKQVPHGRAWYLYRFAMSDLSIQLAPFRG